MSDTDHYLVVAKGRERLAVSKQRKRKISFGEVQFQKFKRRKEQYKVEISNRFTALEQLDAEGNINRALETLGENLKISAKESR
jgi:hypothetical protein